MAVVVNPSDEIPVEDLLLAGTGIAGLTTNVGYRTGQLGGDSVGLGMLADPLGPDHDQGSPPRSSAQRELMGRLATDPSASPEGRYIRGHLLHDDVGGPGEPRNLFPITHWANQQHRDHIEEDVLQWVNRDRLWVKYDVRVTKTGENLSHTGKDPRNYVDADLRAKIWVRQLDGDFELRRDQTIRSRYRVPQAAAERTVVEAGVGRRAEDEGASIRLSTRRSERLFDPHLLQTLRNHRLRHGWRRIDDTLRTESGIGAARVALVHKAYRIALQNGTTDLSGELNTAERSALTVVNSKAETLRRRLDGLEP